MTTGTVSSPLLETTNNANRENVRESWPRLILDATSKDLLRNNLAAPASFWHYYLRGFDADWWQKPSA